MRIWRRFKVKQNNDDGELWKDELKIASPGFSCASAYLHHFLLLLLLLFYL
jgi:hypothetical protein